MALLAKQISVTPAQWEWVEQQAAGYQISTGEYLRRLIDTARSQDAARRQQPAPSTQQPTR